MDAKEYLTVAVSGEQLSVSYSMLSRKFGISPKDARQVLTEYLESNKNDTSLHVTYCLRGMKKHGVSTIELCEGSEVATKRAEYNEPVSQLIYAISASPTTSTILYNMALEASSMGPNKFAIVSKLAEGIDLTPVKPAIKDDSPPAPVSKPVITTAPAKKPAAKQKPKLDFFGGKKKSEKEGKKEATPEEKKDKEDKEEEKKKDEKETTPVEAPSKPKKSVLDAVKEGKKNEPKPKEPAPKSKKQLEAEEAEKKRKQELAEALFADDDEDFDIPVKKKETVKEELKEDLEKAKKETEKDAAKIAGGKLDVTTEDVEMGDDDGKTEDVEMTDVHMTNDGEDVHTQTQTKKRGKKKVITKVKELDEDGYVTYRKVETWESCDEEEDESGMKEEIKKKEVKKEVKKESKTESPEPSSGAKKGKKANKQSSLMSFFKK